MKNKELKTAYKNYVFDLYGTLIDIRTDENDPELWFKTAIFMGENGAPYRPEELKTEYEAAVREELGQPSEDPAVCSVEISVERIFAKLYRLKGIEADPERVRQTCIFFRISSMKRFRLFPGVKEQLKELREKGAGLYLLTNAQRVFTEKEIGILGLEPYFDGILMSSDHGFRKPDQRFYRLLFDTFGIDPSESVMIGDDRTSDIYGGQCAGMAVFHVVHDKIQEAGEADGVRDHGRPVYKWQ